MMKRSGLQLRQLDGQGPYSSRALRAFTSTRTAPPVSSSGAAAAAAICLLDSEEAPLTGANNYICSGNSPTSIKSLKEALPTTTALLECAAVESISNGAKAVDCYSTPKVTKPAWRRWNCFMPWESYTTDVSIDVEKHHTPKNFTDKLAYYTVQTLKIPINFLCQRRHTCHAMLLETVGAIPGMVGGMLLHLNSLRRFEHSGGWIESLLEEAENERMHLMTFIELAKPKWYEQAMVITVQWAFFNAYFLAYVVSPQLAHRFTGYLEEEAVILYTEFLKDLDSGRFENIPAPKVAIDYWRLTPDSTLRDVVVVIRADEAHHRDLNHYASDIYCQGRELKGAPLLQLDTTYKFKPARI